MPARKDMKNVLQGFLSAFVSRNNDIGGYWALGVLYRHAQSHGTNFIRINLLSSAVTPDNSQFSKYIKAYADYVYLRFSLLRIPRDWLQTGSVSIAFNQPDTDAVNRQIYGHMGEPYICKVEFIDDLGQRRSVETRGRCRKHDPQCEHRSTRVFAGYFPRPG